MAFRIRSSHVIALLITAGIAGWMVTGTLDIGGSAKPGEAAVPIAEREAERSAQLFKVRYVPAVPEERNETVLVRGRTAANATIAIRTETGGILERRLVSKGDRVAPGDLVCVIEQGVRQSRVAQAEAQLAQAQADFEANSSLREKGFTTEAKMNQLKAALNAAKTALAEAKWDLERTEVRANAGGIVIDPIAEPGEVLSVGGSCVTLMDTNPMLFVGQVSERQVGRIETGMRADVTLVTGDRLAGTVRYIAPAADAQTRTFLTEIALVDPDGKARDGITASAEISLPASTAYRLSPSWITLADDGTVGVRVVDAEDRVQFVPVSIVRHGRDGLWVTGLTAGARLITLGQEYVVSGEKVEPMPDPLLAELEESARAAEPAD